MSARVVITTALMALKTAVTVATMVTVAMVATVTPAPVHANPNPNPPRKYGEYEKRAIAFALDKLGLELDPEPEGKTIARVRVFNLQIFGPRNGFLQVLNYLHRTTRKSAIRRELLLRAGQAWNWTKVRENERNLRNPLLSILAVIVPVRSQTPGQVDLLVVTRDSWSLRTDSAFEIQAGILSKLVMEPSDFNFLGLRKQLGAKFIMNLSDYTVGPVFYDRNTMGTRLRSYYLAGLVFNRRTNAREGSLSKIEFDYPLWSLDREWGALAEASHHFYVSRLFQETELNTYDAPETPEDDAVPWEYRMRNIALDLHLLRALGTRLENRFTVGYELRVQRPEVTDDFAGDQVVRDAFIRDVLPRSERTSALLLRYRMFQPRFGQYRNIKTFDLPEDTQLGPEVILETALAAKFLYSENDFIRLGATARWTQDLGGLGYARLQASASTRVEQNDARDVALDVESKVVLPPIGKHIRVLLRGRIARRLNDRQNIVFALGGETGLRGYVIGAFVGPAMAIGNLELRSSPTSLGFMKVGATAFWDFGHAAESLSALEVHHNVGAGLRILIPQFGQELIRIDWAFALRGPTRGFPGRLSVGYDQVF